MSEGELVADDGVPLWFAADGVGRPLVLCHGGPGLWDNLEPLAHLLTGVARVIRWEQRGCGRSARQGPYTVARSVADLDHLREHLGYQRWVVGGHSWGATLALQYALTMPARVDALVYVAGVGLGRAWNRAYHAEADRRLTSEQRQRRDRLETMPRALREEHEYRTLCWAPDFADQTRALDLASSAADVLFDTNYECNAALNEETKTWDERDLLERCRRLDVPALVIHGAVDPRPSWAVDSLVDALPKATLEVLPNAGHLPWIEAPAEFAHAVTAFLVSKVQLTGA